MTVQNCAELVLKGDKLRFKTTMAAPLAAREVLFPIHAFCLEVAKAPWVTQESMIAEMRLQFWRDVLQEKADGKEPRAHEVAAPLAAVLDSSSAQALDASVTARQWDIYREPHEDEAAFIAYLHKSYALPMNVAARLLGAPEDTSKALNSLAMAGGLARYFLAIPALEGHGRIPLVDGRAEAISKLAKATYEQALWGKSQLTALPKEAKAPLFDALLHLPILKQVAKAPGIVAAGAIAQIPLKQSLRLAAVSQLPWALIR